MHRLYLILRAFNVGSSCALLVLLMAAFALAFVFMFIYPLASLILVFLGLGGLWGSAILRKLASIVQLRVARSLLSQGLCPNCGNSRSDNIGHACQTCEACFESGGIMIVATDPDDGMKSSVPEL